MTIDYTRPPAPPPPAPAPGFNWSGCLKACGIGCGILALLVVIGVAGIVVFVFGAIRHTDVYTGAVQRAKQNPEVMARLGTPIETKWWVKGNIKIDNHEGSASIDIPIRGPKGDATIDCEAIRDDDQWRYTRLRVIDAGEPIDLLSAQRPAER